MLTKRRFWTALSGFIFLNAYGFYVHGTLLANEYALMPESTYRSEESFLSLIVFVIVAYGLMAVAMTAIKNDNWGCTKDGMIFGAWMGLFVGAVNLINFAVYPWPVDLVISAILADLFMGAFTGAVMAFVNNKFA